MPKPTKTQVQKLAAYTAAIEELVRWDAKDLPNLSNYTAPKLVDIVGDLKEVEKSAKKVIATLNGVIDTKLTDKEKADKTVRGESYEMNLSDVSQYRLDTEVARSKLTELANILYSLDPSKYPSPEEVLESVHTTIDMVQHRYSAL